MEAAERTISQILTEQICYTIPPYQRPYSWEKGNVERLLDDVWEAYAAGDEEYFIGSLITIERDKGALYEVVDGQQRLTTLNLILARLRDRIEEPEVAPAWQAGPTEEPLHRGGGDAAADASAKDQAFFRRHVLAGQSVTEAVRRDVDRDQDTPKQRIVEHLDAIDGFLSERDQRTLRLFANYLLRKVYVVFVTTASLPSAYRLFNVLNARGMALSNADLIRTCCSPG